MIINETTRDVETNLRIAERTIGVKMMRIILGVLGGIFLVLGIVLLLIEGLGGELAYEDITNYVIIFIAAAALIAFACSYRAILRASIKKSMQGKIAATRYIMFEDGNYEVHTTLNDGTESNIKGSYSAFTSVKEYKDMWILYINGGTLLPLLKSGMVEGTAEELSELLKKNVGSLYKKCYK